MMKFPDSTSLVVNSFGGSPNPALTRIGLSRDVFASCALTN